MWESPEGGLWFSIILRPKVPSLRLPLLQFLASNAARQALEDEAGLSVELKWPNDLLIGNAKLGGILVESKTIGDNVPFAILGIGLNVNQGKAQLPIGATSLHLISGKRHDLRLLLRAILDQLRSWYDDLEHPSRIMEDWWSHCIHRRLRVQVAISNRTITGISRGIDEDGSLLVETDDHKIRKVSEGSLRILDE